MVNHETKMDVPTICFGFTLGFVVLTGSKAGKQTLMIYRRTGSIMNLYLMMIWIEVVVCLAWACSAWLFLRGDIPASFGFFFAIAIFWTIQTQCLLQIIANRIALVMVERRQSRILRIALLIAVGLINISVYCIWIPARMKTSPTWIYVNAIWDRAEKVIYLFIDLGLNVYFLYIVRSKLIAQGLIKYQALFRFNASIVVISICMDALIIGTMSLPNDLVYTQFQCLAYIVKLNIELSMADLISKVVRHQNRTDKGHDSISNNPSDGAKLTSYPQHTILGPKAETSQPSQTNTDRRQGQAAEVYDQKQRNVANSGSSSTEGMRIAIPEDGIVKTVATIIRNERMNRGSADSTTAYWNEYSPGSVYSAHRIWNAHP